MRTRALVALTVASVLLILPGGLPATATTQAQAAVSADKGDDKGGGGGSDKDEKGKEAPRPEEPPKALERPAPGVAFAFATYRVFATQFEPTVPGSVEVAVPDKCVKFAALRNAATLAALKCPPSYTLDRDYRMVVTRDGSTPGIVPVKEAGPWNIDDNWWSGRRADEPRRMYRDLPAGRPEAQVASSSGYNMVDDCKDLEGKPTGTKGGADQFGRCARNAAGIDLSVAAARALGFRPLENAWVNVTLLWEPVELSVVNVKSGKALDVKDGSKVDAAPVLVHSYLGGGNQIWRLRPVGGDVYTLSVGHSGKLLDVRDRSTLEGAPLMQHAATGGTNQQWRLVPQGGASPPAVLGRTSGVYELVSVGSGKVLDVAGAATGEDVPVVQSAPTGASNQSWTLTILEPPAPAPAKEPPAASGDKPANGSGAIASPRELPAG